jgi:molecular chaperone HtpG
LEKSRFVRVDSDVIDKLIPQTEVKAVTLSEEEKTALSDTFKAAIPAIDKTEFLVTFEQLGETAHPVTITQGEFMRRMQEMSAMQQGFNFYGELPDSYNLALNIDHPLIKKVQENKEDNSQIVNQLVDLALLSNGLLKGEALNKFIKRSLENIQ